MLTDDLIRKAFQCFTDKHSRTQAYRERRDLPLELVDLKFHQANKSDPFEFEGYGSVWNRIDSYGDTMLPGAFTEALKARRPMMFFGHSPGRVPGKWTSSKEDDQGLKQRGQLTPGHREATDIEASLRHGSLSGLSVGGYTKKAKWREVDGEILGRDIEAFDLYEVSIVSMPAETEARIDGSSIKSVLDECTTLSDFEDLLREVAGFSKTTATAFVARMLRFSRGEPEATGAPNANAGLDELLEAMKRNPIPKFLTEPNTMNALRSAIRSRLMLDLKDDGGAGGGGGAPPTAAEIKSFEDLKGVFLATHKQIREFVEKANAEAAANGKVSTETKSALASLTETINTLGQRLDKIEAKGNRDGEGGRIVTLGSRFTALADYKAMTGQSRKARLDVEGESLTDWIVKAITNATGQSQPLVPDMRVPGIQTTPNRRLRIRQLLPTGRTTSNLVQFVRENVFTNSAGPQAGSSPTVAGENVTKPESDITFTLANAPVVTIAHFILASRQVLDDAPMLESYINGRLLYGLALEEEDEILNGDGTVGQLDGLMHQATAYNRAETGTKLDWLRRAITQLQLSEYDAEFIVLNPADWESIELTKDTQGRYIIANPVSMLGPMIWGLPVVPTNSQGANQFLVANGSQAAQIWDRQSAAVELSREDSDNFRKNMVTLLAEERLALTVYRPTALIKGTFTV